MKDDYKDKLGNWVRSERIEGRRQCTKSGVKWDSINSRCLVGGSLQRDFPAYLGCTNDFSSFNTFVGWHIHQKGYELSFEIDKDLLVCGNKSYNEYSCVLLPKVINTFFGKHTRARGLWPQGIDMCTTSPLGKFRAQIRIDGRSQHLGYFSDVEQAKAVYIKAKTARARVLAQEYRDCLDVRAYDALNTKQFYYSGLDLLFQ